MQTRTGQTLTASAGTVLQMEHPSQRAHADCTREPRKPEIQKKKKNNGRVETQGTCICCCSSSFIVPFSFIPSPFSPSPFSFSFLSLFSSCFSSLVFVCFSDLQTPLQSHATHSTLVRLSMQLVCSSSIAQKHGQQLALGTVK